MCRCGLGPKCPIDAGFANSRWAFRVFCLIFFFFTEVKLRSGHPFKFLPSAHRISGSARVTINSISPDSWLFFHFYEATWLLKLVSKLLFPRTSLLLATFDAADTVFSLPQFGAMIWALEAFHATVSRETLNRHLYCVSKSCLINWIYNS